MLYEAEIDLKFKLAGWQVPIISPYPGLSHKDHAGSVRK
jgi:hypothetical protein